MHLQPPKPSRDPYARAVSLWVCTGVVFFAWPILAEITRPDGAQQLRDVGELPVVFMAIAAVIVVAWKRDDAVSSGWMGIAAGLSASVAAVAALAQLHVAWQGREFGYAFLLFVAAYFGPKIRGMSNHAPEPLVARMKWYMGVLGQGALTILMVTSAWSLAMPTGLGGDPAHPPARGLVILAVWPAAVLALVLIGWPAAKRLLKGGLSPIAANGERRLLLSRVVGTLGLGLLFIASGVHGAVIGPDQSHPVSAELAAGILIWLGFWIERRVVREVLGLRRRRASL